VLPPPPPAQVRDGQLTPLDACINFVVEYASVGLSQKSVIDGPQAHRMFTHRMLCAEMFLVLIDDLNQLSDIDIASDMGGFAINAADCCGRCKLKLTELQLAAPNSFRLCHTLLSFVVIATEFYQRVECKQRQPTVHYSHHLCVCRHDDGPQISKALRARVCGGGCARMYVCTPSVAPPPAAAYRDQGFFADDLVAGASFAMEGRHQELLRYVHRLLLPSTYDPQLLLACVMTARERPRVAYLYRIPYRTT
jgi:hypothetical protein